MASKRPRNRFRGNANFSRSSKRLCNRFSGALFNQNCISAGGSYHVGLQTFPFFGSNNIGSLFRASSHTPVFGTSSQFPVLSGRTGGMSLFSNQQNGVFDSKATQSPNTTGTVANFSPAHGADSLASYLSSHSAVIPHYFSPVLNANLPSYDKNWTPASGIISPDLNQSHRFQEMNTVKDEFQCMNEHETRIIHISYPEDSISGPKFEAKQESVYKKWISCGFASKDESVDVLNVDDQLETWIEELRNLNKSETSLTETAQLDPVEASAKAWEPRQRIAGLYGFRNEHLRCLLPVVSRSDYYIEPCSEALLALMMYEGRDAIKRVHGVEIGRHGYGKVTFPKPVNLERLDIVKSVRFEKGTLHIPADSPLNGVQCMVTLSDVSNSESLDRASAN
eukprot:g4321.t1